jgi:hypothetical protein
MRTGMVWSIQFRANPRGTANALNKSEHGRFLAKDVYQGAFSFLGHIHSFKPLSILVASPLHYSRRAEHAQW